MSTPSFTSNDSDLTESTDYTSEQSSTTINSENKSEHDTDSYFSDGAWLLSKSEGQIIPVNHNSYVNLDLDTAVKGMIMSPNKNKPSVGNINVRSSYNSQSEGEVKLGKLNRNDMLNYGGKPKTGINRIKPGSESGEIVLDNQNGKVKPLGSDKSEGEVENPSIVYLKKQNEILDKSLDKKHKKSHNSSKNKSHKPDKMSVDLKSSPKKTSQKSKIKIQAIRKFLIS